MTKYKIHCFTYEADFDLELAFRKCFKNGIDVESSGHFYEVRDVKNGKDFVLLELRKLQADDLPKKGKRKQEDQSLALAPGEGVTTRAWMIFDLKSKIFGTLNTRIFGPSRLVALLAKINQSLEYSFLIKPDAWKRIKAREKEIVGLEVRVASVQSELSGQGWDQQALAIANTVKADHAKLWFTVQRGKGALANVVSGLKKLLAMGALKSAKVKLAKQLDDSEEDLAINLLRDQLTYDFESDYKANSMAREDAYGHLKLALQRFREETS